MTIYRTITPDGKLLYYHVRLQRKQGGTGYFYSMDLEEVKDRIREHWEKADNRYVPASVMAKRRFEITDRILYGRRAKKWADEKKTPVIPEKKRAVAVAGCLIMPAEGRCEKAWDCDGYTKCLDAAWKWPGWKRVGAV